jgi:hypothetical protein
MPARPHGAGCDTTEISRQVSGDDRLVMIRRSRLRTRDAEGLALPVRTGSAIWGLRYTPVRHAPGPNASAVCLYRRSNHHFRMPPIRPLQATSPLPAVFQGEAEHSMPMGPAVLWRFSPIHF